MLGEAFGAVATLQQEAAAFGDVGKSTLQTARFACKHQRRILREARFGRLKRCQVRIVRHLLDGFLPPAVWSPSLCHFDHLLSAADLSARVAP
ncbi:hypothetical protein D9M72_487890 [compost metagenome]